MEWEDRHMGTIVSQMNIAQDPWFRTDAGTNLMECPDDTGDHRLRQNL